MSEEIDKKALFTYLKKEFVNLEKKIEMMDDTIREIYDMLEEVTKKDDKEEK